MTFDIVTDFPYTESTGYFNSSIVECDGRRVLFSRRGVWNGDTLFYDSSIVCLTDGVLQNVNIREHEFEQLEDPRAFVYNGKIYLSCASMDSRDKSIVNQKLFCFNSDLSFINVIPIKVPHQLRYEKNWSYFQSCGKLYCIYSLDPYIIYDVETGEKLLDERIKWNFDCLRVSAGSNPILVDDLYYAFMHGYHLVNKKRVYSMGFYAFEPTFPFNIVRHSRIPLAEGDESIGFIENSDYCQSVIYPTGCIVENDSFIVSVGVNNWKTALMRIDMDELKKYE